VAAIDDLTELVERAAAVEKVALSSKWKERAEVALLVARVGKNADECREDLARDVDHQSLSSRWVLLRRDYLTLGGQEPLPGQVAARAGEPPAADWPGRAPVVPCRCGPAERDAVAAVDLARIALTDAALAVLQALAHGLTGEIRYILTRKPRATVKSLAITLALGLLYLGWIRLAEWDKESRFLPYLGLWVTGGSAVSTAQDPPGDAEGDHRLQGERGDEGVRAGGRPASRRAISNKPRRPLPADMWGLRVKG